MDIVDRMFELIDAQYKEQRDFATAIGVDASHISRWRNRKTSSYQRRLPQIAEALGTTVEYLLTGKQNSPTPEEGVELPAVWAKLSRENQEKALEYMQMLKALEEKR